jgi:hypothetical protein
LESFCGGEGGPGGTGGIGGPGEGPGVGEGGCVWVNKTINKIKTTRINIAPTIANIIDTFIFIIAHKIFV